MDRQHVCPELVRASPYADTPRAPYTISSHLCTGHSSRDLDLWAYRRRQQSGSGCAVAEHAPQPKPICGKRPAGPPSPARPPRMALPPTADGVLEDGVEKYRRAALAESSRRTYGVGVSHFRRFLAQRGLSVEDLGTEVSLLRDLMPPFLAFLADSVGVRPSTAEQYLTHVGRFLHDERVISDPSLLLSFELTCVKRGFRRLHAASAPPCKGDLSPPFHVGYVSSDG